MRRPRTKRRLIGACAGSLALHALVFLGVARMSWETADDAPNPAVSVVWLGDLRLPNRVPTPTLPARERREPVPLQLGAEPSPEAELDRSPQTEPQPSPQTEPQPSPQPEPQPSPQPEPQTSPQAEPEPSPQAEPEPPPEPRPAPLPEAESERAPERAETLPAPQTPPPTAPDRPSESYVVTEADLEEAWRRAREAAREQAERERNYLTFSLDDAVESPSPEEPGPEESIFEAAERFRGRGAPSVMAPGSGRTRVGRALAELCNALTGGFGIGLNGMTFATVCADPGESAKLFADIKPTYLRSRPVCTEVETAAAAADGASPTIKCELVEQPE